MNPAAGLLTLAEWNECPPLARSWVMVGKVLLPLAKRYDEASKAERAASAEYQRRRRGPTGPRSKAWEAWRAAQDVTINARRDLADAALVLLTGSKEARCAILSEFLAELLGSPASLVVDSIGCAQGPKRRPSRNGGARG